MDALLIRTEGHALEAEIEVDGHRLCVMDQFSSDDRPAPPGVLKQARFSVLEVSQLPWEAVFSGNPDRQKRLERVSGWSYLGYGEVIAICPTVVDFGILRLEVGPATHDRRCIGEFVKVQIDRLALSVDA